MTISKEGLPSPGRIGGLSAVRAKRGGKCLERRTLQWCPLETIWELPDELWERLEPVLAGRYPPARTGRPRAGSWSNASAPPATRSGFCLDKGYDNPSDREATEAARRWVVERTLVGLSKCRAILVRYDKNPLNYLALIQLACARQIPARRLHKIHQPDTF